MQCSSRIIILIEVSRQKLQKTHLDCCIRNTDMINDTPLNGQGRQAQGSALLSQVVQACIGIAIVGLACRENEKGITIKQQVKRI